MGKHTHSVTCPACDGTIHAETQGELVTLVQIHARDHHNKHLTAEHVLEMARQQAE
jgi:hypothetical protein